MRPEPEPQMTPEAARRDHWQTLRHMVMCALSGLLAGAVATGALFLLDIGAIGTLVARSIDPALAAATMLAPFSLAGTAAGCAIGLLPYLRKLRR